MKDIRKNFGKYLISKIDQWLVKSKIGLTVSHKARTTRMEVGVLSNKHVDVVKSADGANPVFVVKNEEIGRNVNFDENQAERLYRELDHSLKTLGIVPDEENVLDELTWSDIMPVIIDSKNRLDLFISQFKNRNWEEIEQEEFEDFLGHLEDAHNDLENWMDEHYYEDVEADNQ